jgi:hypothetical protein
MRLMVSNAQLRATPLPRSVSGELCVTGIEKAPEDKL